VPISFARCDEMLRDRLRLICTMGACQPPQQIKLPLRALYRLLNLAYLQECGNLKVCAARDFAQRAFYEVHGPYKPKPRTGSRVSSRKSS
jgi:hypothetical protein